MSKKPHKKKVTPKTVEESVVRIARLLKGGAVEVDELELEPVKVGGGIRVVGSLKPSGEDGHLLVEVMVDSKAKGDWETYVCYQPMSWDEFARERPEGCAGDVRVFAAKDYSFSLEFADSDKCCSFRLATRDSGEFPNGYTDVSRRVGKGTKKLIEENQGRNMAMIPGLCVPEGGLAKRAVLIKRLADPFSLYADRPMAEDL